MDNYNWVAPLLPIPEDAFDLPPPQRLDDVRSAATEDHHYEARYSSSSESFLYKVITTERLERIGTFDDFDAANLAAQALNEHKGY
jgi:hypothetical protein